MAIGETIFDIAYLITVLTVGIIMIIKSKDVAQYRLFGIMAVTLGAGDAFHLVPRVIALCTDGLANHAFSLGIGKCVTSITMTAFYVLLYYVWRSRYKITKQNFLTASVWILGAVRVILCLCPQNKWTCAEAPLSWGIYRNIPFTLLGILIVVLFLVESYKKKDRPFRFLWLAVTISFACYIPVVLFADIVPIIGVLMIPKTCAYVWAVLIGYIDMRKNIKAQI